MAGKRFLKSDLALYLVELDDQCNRDDDQVGDVPCVLEEVGAVGGDVQHFLGEENAWDAKTREMRVVVQLLADRSRRQCWPPHGREGGACYVREVRHVFRVEEVRVEKVLGRLR
eukprot:1881176-Rhodomonas_salina.2